MGIVTAVFPVLRLPMTSTVRPFFQYTYVLQMFWPIGKISRINYGVLGYFVTVPLSNPCINDLIFLQKQSLSVISKFGVGFMILTVNTVQDRGKITKN